MPRKQQIRILDRSAYIFLFFSALALVGLYFMLFQATKTELKCGEDPFSCEE